MSGQTLTDRIAAAQYSLTGSEVARAVCKATTHEVMAPKKKHLECKLVQVKITPLSALFMSIKYTYTICSTIHIMVYPLCPSSFLKGHQTPLDWLERSVVLFWCQYCGMEI